MGGSSEITVTVESRHHTTWRFIILLIAAAACASACFSTAAKSQIVTNFTESYSANYDAQVYGYYNGTYYDDGGYGFAPVYCGTNCVLGTLPLSGSLSYGLTPGNGTGPLYSITNTGTLSGAYNLSWSNTTYQPASGYGFSHGLSASGGYEDAGFPSAVGSVYGSASGFPANPKIFAVSNDLTPFPSANNALGGTASLTNGAVSIQQNSGYVGPFGVKPYTTVSGSLTGGTASYTASEGPAPPSVQQYVTMADHAWTNPVVGTASGTSGYSVLTTTQLTAVPTAPLNATAYYTGNPSDGGQIVVAIAGGPGVQELADPSFLTGIPTPAFTQGVNDALNFLTTIAKDYPTASISLTGVSAGGGVAQILGVLTGLQTVTFSAPGALNLVSYYTAPSYFQIANVLTPHDVSSQTQTSGDIINYRQYGDQLSLFGQQAGQTITLTPAVLQPAIDATGPAIFANLGVLIGLVHSGVMLKYDLSQPGAPQIPGQAGVTWSAPYPNISSNLGIITASQSISQGVTTTTISATRSGSPGYTPGPNYTSVVNNPLVLVPTEIYELLQLAVASYQAVVKALQEIGIDPPAGYSYSLAEDANSPTISSIDLPIDSDISGWVLSWTADNGDTGTITTHSNLVDLVPGVRNIDFYAVDVNGNPMFYDNFDNPEMVFGLSFADDGTFNAMITTDVGSVSSTVPEPSSAATLGAGLFGLLVIGGVAARLRSRHDAAGAQDNGLRRSHLHLRAGGTARA